MPTCLLGANTSLVVADEDGTVPVAVESELSSSWPEVADGPKQRNVTEYRKGDAAKLDPLGYF